MVHVPREPPFWPITISPIQLLPLETVICPTPFRPKSIRAKLFVATNCPPTTHTTPVEFAPLATSTSPPKSFVPLTRFRTAVRPAPPKVFKLFTAAPRNVIVPPVNRIVAALLVATSRSAMNVPPATANVPDEKLVRSEEHTSELQSRF